MCLNTCWYSTNYKTPKWFFKWINQSYQEKMLSVKIYWNLKRNICYGIYFNKFHAICKGKFQKCGNTFTFCTDILEAARPNQEDE
jgi:hypothetical protein